MAEIDPSTDIHEDVLIFDGDCGFCSRSVNWGQERDLIPAKVVANQRIDPADFGLSTEDVESAVWLVSPGGTKRSGSDAIAVMLAASRFPYSFIGSFMRLPGVSNLARYSYRLIAKNRHRLSGSGSSCSLPPRA